MNVDRLAYQVGGAIKRLRADLAKAEQDAAMWHEAHDVMPRPEVLWVLYRCFRPVLMASGVGS